MMRSTRHFGALAVGVAFSALAAGADDFLSKPFSGDRLRVTLRNLIAALMGLKSK